MATNTFVYWSDGLGARAFDHHSRNRGPAGPDICPFFFKCPGFAQEFAGGGGGECSRLELTRTLGRISFHHSKVNKPKPAVTNYGKCSKFISNYSKSMRSNNVSQFMSPQTLGVNILSHCIF